MKITVRFAGPLRRPWPEESRALELAEGADVGALLGGLGYSPEESRRIIAVVQGEKKTLFHVLSDGDEIRLLLLAGGG